MANINGSTISTLLCGGIISNLTSATIRSLITSDSPAGKSVLSQVTFDSDTYISTPYSTQLVRDTGSTFTSSSGTYLSASSTSFANITSSSYSGSTYYITNYIDTGNPSTSYLISYENKSTTIQGFTTYTIDDNKLLFFKDTNNTSRFTYRYFNELLITSAVGSLSTIGIALLSNTFPRNINNTNYTEISSFIIAENTIQPYILSSSNSCDLKTNGSFIPLTANSTGSVGSVIFYTNPTSVPSSRTLMCIISGSSVGATYNTTAGSVVYFKPYQSTILDIS